MYLKEKKRVWCRAGGEGCSQIIKSKKEKNGGGSAIGSLARTLERSETTSRRQDGDGISVGGNKKQTLLDHLEVKNYFTSHPTIKNSTSLKIITA